MHSETIYKIAFGLMAVLIVWAIAHANNRARAEHGSRFAQAANEYPILLWVRGLLAIPAYAGLIDWLFHAQWFPWAYVPLPAWVRWMGVGLAGIVVALNWWTQLALGSNYHGTMGLHPNHKLVTGGPYRLVRHPMYAIFLFVPIALFLLSRSWLVGAPAVCLIFTVSLVRARIEERQLIERFGDEYRTYMERTGRFFPRPSGRSESS